VKGANLERQVTTAAFSLNICTQVCRAVSSNTFSMIFKGKLPTSFKSYCAREGTAFVGKPHYEHSKRLPRPACLSFLSTLLAPAEHLSPNTQPAVPPDAIILTIPPLPTLRPRENLLSKPHNHLFQEHQQRGFYLAASPTSSAEAHCYPPSAPRRHRIPRFLHPIDVQPSRASPPEMVAGRVALGITVATIEKGPGRRLVL